jgi:hypothetical protein
MLSHTGINKMPRLNINVTLHRLVGKKLTAMWTRPYARVETAMSKCMAALIIDGQVGDVFEIHLRSNGMQVGTMRLKADGKVEVLWNTDEARRLKIAAVLEKSNFYTGNKK